MTTTTTSLSKGVQILYQHGALGPGSELWIIPDIESSSWTKLLDWYVNFQITRAQNHSPLKLSPELQEILSENEIDAFKASDHASALMIATEDKLPNKQLIQLSNSSDLSGWFKQAHTIWQELDRPTLRIFLPTNFDSSKFLKYWPSKDGVQDITLVPAQNLDS